VGLRRVAKTVTGAMTKDGGMCCDHILTKSPFANRDIDMFYFMYHDLRWRRGGVEASCQNRDRAMTKDGGMCCDHMFNELNIRTQRFNTLATDPVCCIFARVVCAEL
jgi:hypothetical protein